MSFEQMVRVPKERVGVIIGRSGEEKKELEELLKVKLTVESETGEVMVKAEAADLEEVDPFKAIEVIDAIGDGVGQGPVGRDGHELGGQAGDAGDAEVEVRLLRTTRHLRGGAGPERHRGPQGQRTYETPASKSRSRS